MNLYEIEDEVQPAKRSDFGGKLHVFVLDLATRRMVCSQCGGKMNDCPAYCPKFSKDRSV